MRRLAQLLAFLAALALALFCLQNTTPVGVRFLVWGREGVPLCLVVLAALGVGLMPWLLGRAWAGMRRLAGRRR